MTMAPSVNGYVYSLAASAPSIRPLHPPLHPLPPSFLSLHPSSTSITYVYFQQATIEHVLYLLGYADGKLHVQPMQLRASPVVDAVISNLPRVSIFSLHYRCLIAITLRPHNSLSGPITHCLVSAARFEC